MVKLVAGTDHVSFDENFKTFRLISGQSLYAFCISPELTLEHLYWGKTLSDTYDLRYLSQNCRMSHFNTVEAAPHSFDGKIVLEAETLEEIQKTWRMNTNKHNVSKDSEEYFNKSRIENYSWRMMSKFAQQATHRDHRRSSMASKSTDAPTRRKSLSVTFADGLSMEEEFRKKEEDVEDTGSARATRRRSVSLPLDPVTNSMILAPSEDLRASASMDEDHDLSFLDLNAIAKMTTSASFPSPHRKEVLGAKNRSPMRHHANRQTFERQLGKVGKGTLCVEYTDHGTGDFRTPSFMVVDNYNGSSISPLRYRRHKIYKGKLAMPDHMPGIRCMDDAEASTLVITLVDLNSKLEVDLIYVAMHNYDCITRRAVFRNMHDNRKKEHGAGGPKTMKNGERSKVIHKASSLTIDFELSSSAFHLVQLCGSWARENNMLETKLQQGMHSFGSTRGVSSHQHNPFAAVTVGAPSETSGETKGFCLIYSGNFLVEAEINEMGRLRINLGIHPMTLQWYLNEGGAFHTPEAVLVRASDGLGGMSRTLHRLVLDRLIPKNWSDQDPPILLNTWEAKYFHINHDNIVDMAHQAAKVGINLIVVDDGWFGKRETDCCSLGDWVVDLAKFPHGIKGLAEEVNALGLKFGLWFEPEMVSEQSALFTAHPDWTFQIPGRPRQIGRNQMVLDLSRQDVVDYVYNTMAAVLSSANIEFVKWDMNRPLTEVFSILAGYGEVWQAEVGHRYVLGVYQVQSRLAADFPHILFETCASGGGRFDLGMLYYSPQIWCSDNTDALVRMRIQYGTSLAYPARCIGSHVSSAVNHLTGNSVRLRTRGFVAMCGTFGYELDLSACSAADRLIFQRQCEFYRQIAPIVRWGDIYRLWNPFQTSLAAWMYVSRDKSQAVVFAFSVNSDHWSNLVPRLQLQGLLEEAEYDVAEPHPNNLAQHSGQLMMIETEVPMFQLGVSSICMTGEVLMNAGLPMKFYTLDDSAVFVLTQRQVPAATPSSVATQHSSPQLSPLRVQRPVGTTARATCDVWRNDSQRLDSISGRAHVRSP